MDTLMRYLLIISLFLFNCSPKIVSEKTDTVKTIEINTRDYKVKFDKLGVIDTTDLSRLKRGETIKKTDKKTGIKTGYRIKNKELIANSEVPERIKKVTVSDSVVTVTTNKEDVIEKRKGFFAAIKSYIYEILITILIVIAAYVSCKALT